MFLHIGVWAVVNHPVSISDLDSCSGLRFFLETIASMHARFNGSLIVGSEGTSILIAFCGICSARKVFGRFMDHYGVFYRVCDVISSFMFVREFYRAFLDPVVWELYNST